MKNQPNQLSFNKSNYRVVAILFCILFFPLLILELPITIALPITIVIGILIFLIKSVTTIDIEKKRYRTEYKLFNKSYGKWENLPDISYISLTKTLSVSKSDTLGYNSKDTDNLYKINFIYSKNKRMTIYNTEEYDKLLEVANSISEKLELRIYDATTRDRKWLS